MDNKDRYVIGLDFGTDSVRAILANAFSGEVVGTQTSVYRRWSEGLYCDGGESRFRQHPQDYLEAMTEAVRSLTSVWKNEAEKVVSVALDSTGSTPCLCDRAGQPLAMREKWSECPDAMFILWKDHSAGREADEINALLARQSVNYAMYSGGVYSSECFWAKLLHVLRNTPELREEAWSAVELCDYIPSVLTGVTDAGGIMMGHCVTAAKMMWAERWGGYPPRSFFEELDPLLLPVRDHLPERNYDCATCAGLLTPEWAERLGLGTGVKVGVGNIDSHSGAVGAGVRYGRMVMNLGTSACFMAVVPDDQIGGTVVDGVFNQVEGGILPGMYGFEVGLSAFGDIFAWYRRLLGWSFSLIKDAADGSNEETARKLCDAADAELLNRLAKEAESIEVTEDTPLATDWFNGRRSPYPDFGLTASVINLRLGTTAAEMYYALCEAAAFAAKRNIDHLEKAGVRIDELIGIGGIAGKSPFMMQLLADVLQRTIGVSGQKQAGAMGAVIHAATVAGLYPDVMTAQESLCSPAMRTYCPDKGRLDLLMSRYEKYLEMGRFTEGVEN